MEKDERKAVLMGAVESQLEQSNPPEVSFTFLRLIKEGYTESEAKEKIAVVLIEEMYEMLKNNTPFNEKRYVSRLKKLK